MRYLPLIPLGLVMRYRMPTYKWMKYVDCPINILHGTNDRVIKFKSSIQLSKLKPDSTKLYPIIGGGHKDLHNFESYHRALKEILTTGGRAKVDREKTSIDFIRTKKKRK